MSWYLPDLQHLLSGTLRGLTGILPELVLIAFFLLIIIADLFLAKKSPLLAFWLSLAGIVISGYFLLAKAPVRSGAIFAGMIVPDRLSVLFRIIVLLAAILFVLFTRFHKPMQQHLKGRGDLYSVLFAMLTGLHLMIMASSLLMIYLSVEMVSVGGYIMADYLAADRKNTEGAMKYALFGGVCSAVMLYGISLIYALGGTLDLFDPAFTQGINNASPLAAGIALIFVIAGIGFKLSMVLLHFWTPDVYEGAPAPVAAFLSSAPKAAGFALLIRFFMNFHDPLQGVYGSGSMISLIAWAGILSMIAGNFAALLQDNVRRMLAYSSIGHTGLMMLAPVVFSLNGLNALIFYLAVYTLMNMAAFMLADLIEQQTGESRISGYRSMSKRLPVTTAVFVIVLVSLTGLPPTAGFIAKFLLLSAGLEVYNASGNALVLGMVATGALTTVVSLFYYFKIPLYAYLKEGAVMARLPEARPLLWISAALTVILLIAGLYPSLIRQIL